jgi:hypothetical protein
VATVEADANWPGMWRVRFGAKLSDMTNLSRAKDAAGRPKIAEAIAVCDVRFRG